MRNRTVTFIGMYLSRNWLFDKYKRWRIFTIELNEMVTVFWEKGEYPDWDNDGVRGFYVSWIFSQGKRQVLVMLIAITFTLLKVDGRSMCSEGGIWEGEKEREFSKRSNFGFFYPPG